ncbi:hypothetical protein GA0115254_103477, partial [Streptomyces sp. Ncost-T10-10d]
PPDTGHCCVRGTPLWWFGALRAGSVYDPDRFARDTP